MFKEGEEGELKTERVCFKVLNLMSGLARNIEVMVTFSDGNASSELV